MFVFPHRSRQTQNILEKLEKQVTSLLTIYSRPHTHTPNTTFYANWITLDKPIPMLHTQAIENGSPTISVEEFKSNNVGRCGNGTGLGSSYPQLGCRASLDLKMGNRKSLSSAGFWATWNTVPRPSPYCPPVKRNRGNNFSVSFQDGAPAQHRSSLCCNLSAPRGPESLAGIARAWHAANNMLFFPSVTRFMAQRQSLSHSGPSSRAWILECSSCDVFLNVPVVPWNLVIKKTRTCFNNKTNVHDLIKWHNKIRK